MKVSQLILGSVLLFFSALGLYTGLKTPPKNLFEWLGFGSSLLLLFLAVVYLGTDLKGKTTDKKGNILDFLRTDISGILQRLKDNTPHPKDNTLNIDVEVQEGFRAMIALGIIGVAGFICYKFLHGNTAILVFVLALIGAYMYWNENPAPGVYKNGKFLGNIYKGFIKVGDGLSLGKRQKGTIGYLKIMKDGKVVAFLTLTPEAFMELRPEKISEIFPEIKGNVKEFKNLFKVGDYTLQYSLFTRSYRYAKSYAYKDEDNYSKSPTRPAYADLSTNIPHDSSNDWISDPAYSSFEGNIYHDSSNDWFFNPTYSFFEGNIYHDSFHDSFHNSFHDF